MEFENSFHEACMNGNSARVMQFVEQQNYNYNVWMQSAHRYLLTNDHNYESPSSRLVMRINVLACTGLPPLQTLILSTTSWAWPTSKSTHSTTYLLFYPWNLIPFSCSPSLDGLDSSLLCSQQWKIRECQRADWGPCRRQQGRHLSQISVTLSQRHSAPSPSLIL